jgi:ATP-dependent RNA helicase DeaD
MRAAAPTPAPRSQPAAPKPPAPEPTAKPAAEKTYSDEEILASVKNPEPAPLKSQGDKLASALAKPKPKASRATPQGQTRLYMNVGEQMGIAPIDIVNAVSGETGLPGKVVGTVDIRERHLFADVASEHVNSIISKLNRAQIKGHKVKVKVA